MPVNKPIVPRHQHMHHITIHSVSSIVSTATDKKQVAIKTLVDDLSILAVEKCLLQELPHLFSPKTVISLDDLTTTDIAAETEESQAERARANDKMKVLTAALTVLRSLQLFQPLGLTPRKAFSPRSRSDRSKDLAGDDASSSLDLTMDESDVERPSSETAQEVESESSVPAPPEAANMHTAEVGNPHESIRSFGPVDSFFFKGLAEKKGKKSNLPSKVLADD